MFYDGYGDTAVKYKFMMLAAQKQRYWSRILSQYMKLLNIDGTAF